MGNHIPDQDITDQPNTAETFSSWHEGGHGLNVGYYDSINGTTDVPWACFTTIDKYHSDNLNTNLIDGSNDNVWGWDGEWGLHNCFSPYLASYMNADLEGLNQGWTTYTRTPCVYRWAAYVNMKYRQRPAVDTRTFAQMLNELTNNFLRWDEVNDYP
jgi:hypothetical protein